MGEGKILLTVFHTECLNPFLMREKSEKQQSPKLNWILGYDQVDTFIKYHQRRVKLELDFTIWAKLCR